ncbi:MAG: polyamine ABC transporter substrate-binding protein [Steroidobacterales bacterium]
MIAGAGASLRRWRLAAAAAAGLAVCACGGHGSHGGQGPPQETLNIYSWADYIAPDTVANFERETGIKVRYDIYESNEVLETKLLTGRTNYDVVLPTDTFFERLMHAGTFRKLDKSALTNSANLDPEIMQKLAVHDPGNQYATPYLWTTTGIGYNVDKVRERLGTTQFDSWSMILDAKNAARLQDCGITVIDSPIDIFASVLMYLGKDPNSRNTADLEAASAVLMKIRPFVRSIEALAYIGELSNGSMCAAIGWSGDIIQARTRAMEAGNGVKLNYFVPREGALIIVDMMAIPADAPHPQNAERWLNYLMRADVMAGITNAVKYPNGNRAALALVRDALRQDPAIYPDVQIRTRLHSLIAAPPDYLRLVTREWTRFRTGQ